MAVARSVWRTSISSRSAQLPHLPLDCAAVQTRALRYITLLLFLLAAFASLPAHAAAQSPSPERPESSSVDHTPATPPPTTTTGLSSGAPGPFPAADTRMSPGPDPNWFLSSLAPSGAAIFGLFGGLLTSRLVDFASRVRVSKTQLINQFKALRDNVTILTTELQNYLDDIEEQASRAQTEREVTDLQTLLFQVIRLSNLDQLQELTNQLDALPIEHLPVGGGGAEGYRGHARRVLTRVKELQYGCEAHQVGALPYDVNLVLIALVWMAVFTVLLPLAVIAGPDLWLRAPFLVSFTVGISALLAYIHWLQKDIAEEAVLAVYPRPRLSPRLRGVQHIARAASRMSGRGADNPRS